MVKIRVKSRAYGYLHDYIAGALLQSSFRLNCRNSTHR